MIELRLPRLEIATTIAQARIEAASGFFGFLRSYFTSEDEVNLGTSELNSRKEFEGSTSSIRRMRK